MSFGALESNSFTHWILTEQASFYRQLAGAVRATKADGRAAWGLMAISFLYGVFHAAGPGHGKAVISSYLVANNETWWRGVVLSFASALLQAMVAVAIVGIAAVLLGMTGKMMGDAARLIEIVSYALIVVIGLRLVWVKGVAFVRALPLDHRASHDHAHRHDAHHHHHDDRDHAVHSCNHHHHASAWGHAHGPEPQELAGPQGWRRGLGAVIAVGLRPCSGAIIVLTFALAQGLFLAGVAATLAMGLGTALTVTAIASVAVLARGLAVRLAAAQAGRGVLVIRGLETLAALAVLLFGLLLLTGYLVTERLPGL
jgi:nickel/cobalt exporter